MHKSIGAHWQGEGRMMRAFEQAVGGRTLEKFNSLSPEGQRKVLETVARMKNDLGNDSKAIIESMDAVISFYGELRGGMEPNERLVYDTERGAHVSNEELARIVETQVTAIEQQLTAARKPEKREILH